MRPAASVGQVRPACRSPEARSFEKPDGCEAGRASRLALRDAILGHSTDGEDRDAKRAGHQGQRLDSGWSETRMARALPYRSEDHVIGAVALRIDSALERVHGTSHKPVPEQRAGVPRCDVALRKIH